MFERVKRIFGLGKASQPTVQAPFQYQQNNLYGQPPGLSYYPAPYGQAPWMYPMYPGMPNTVPNQGGAKDALYRPQPFYSQFSVHPPYPGHLGNWLPPVPPPGLPSGQFTAVYHPPPYPPPQMYPAPPMANPQASGQTQNFSYGLPAAILAPAPSQAVKEESPSYQWPDGNVKLECTTGQEPEGWDDQGWMWRSSGLRILGLPEDAFKVDKRVCLGVFHCACSSDAGDPIRFFRPKKEKVARDKQRSETCHICHSTLTYVSCTASLTYYMYKDHEDIQHSVRQHSGRHEHGRPPIKVLPAADRAAFDRQVRENPSLTAQQLRAGGGPTQIALGDINPVLLSARKARTEVENSKVRQGIAAPATTRNSGFQLLDSLSTLQDSFETPWIVKSDLMDGRFIVMQTPFMRDVLLQDQIRSWHGENLEAESGRHGLVTDGCHDFFKQGILLTSLVFSQVIMRWAPVLFTWIGKFDERHHKSHFDQLVYVIAELCTKGLGYAFDERLYSAVLDFSTAQRNGFISAFVEFMCARIPGWNTLSEDSRTAEASALRIRAEALIKGCIVHWKRSLHKIKQVLGAKHLFRFEGLIGVLESERTTAAEFLQAVEQIRTEFPEVRPWLAWWILPGNGSMIFPAMQKMPADLRAKLPNSTNASESNHWLLYRAVGYGFDLWEGIRRLYRFQRETEMLYAAIIAGHVNARFQGTKLQPKSRLNWHENDGRAPDTRERLAALQKIEDEFTARNSTLTDAERWTACNSGPALLIVPPPPPSNSTPPSLLFRQSYVWDANSCFIDAPLEAYFRAFIVMGDAVRGELLRRIRTEAPDTGLRDVFEPLWLRGLLSGAIISRSSTVTKPSSTKLMHALQAGQLNVKRLISSKWDGGEFAFGMPGCSRTWLNQMISTETTRDIQKYFGISHTVNYTCNSKHSTKIPSDISVENGIHQGDIFLAHSYTDEGFYRPSLIDYLIHAIPRQRHGASRTDSWPPLHVGAPIPCSHRSCNASEAAVTSITTEWPLILRIDPILHARTMAFDPETPDVACPLILNLGSDVQYTLIARVIYLGPQAEGTIGHYVTKTRLKDSTYMYNDRRRGGLLTELGPLHLLKDHEPNTSFVVYLRTSKSSKTSRTIDEIQTDYAKIPIRPIEPVIPVSDDDTEDELGQIIDQMLIDTITSPPKNAWTSFKPNQVVMLPVPAPDWRASNVLWYPARFIQRYQRRANRFNEYEFQWLECNDGTLYSSDDSNLPVLMLRTHYRSRKFLKEIAEVRLTEKQNPTLTAIFDAAFPQVALILAVWDEKHPAIESFNQYFSGAKSIDRHQKAGDWMRAFGLAPTPELEAVLSAPLLRLMQHTNLAALTDAERTERVMGVGSALFQLLAAQNELGEALNLNGDLIHDLEDESVVSIRSDGNEALNAMFASVSFGSSKMPIDQQMLKFNRTHTVFDEDFRPTMFRREHPSQVPPSDPIPVTIPGGTKRIGDQLTEDEKPSKRAKTEVIVHALMVDFDQ
ncbi:hypothetical protein B0H13DRAFT_1889491 [Mycena leptocephala]|nr:hypothetical protein B0H13DRAFT_1889491 [Mycena leptocephala]